MESMECLRTKAKRSLDLYGLGSWIRSLKKVPRKALQVYAGKAVHILQFRRCLFSVMEVIFVEIARGAEEIVISGALQQEMLLARGDAASWLSLTSRRGWTLW